MGAMGAGVGGAAAGWGPGLRARGRWELWKQVVGRDGAHRIDRHRDAAALPRHGQSGASG